MILISTALYSEAKPFIKYFHLKKDTYLNKFQLFKNDDIILIITKTGPVNAAMAITYLCSLYPPTSSDILLNVGICGSNTHDVLGRLFLCNKITDYSTNRDYYPDLLFQNHFTENSIITYPYMVTNKIMATNTLSCNLIDMEASGIYQGGSLFLAPHQMYFFKIVSDHLDNTFMKPDFISTLVEKYVSEIMNWLYTVTSELSIAPILFTNEEEECLKIVSNYLQLSVSMNHQLHQMSRYYKLLHGTIQVKLEEFLQDIPSPCNSKREGKKYFDKLKQVLI